MTEWLLGCASLLIANLVWEIILALVGGIGVGVSGLLLRTTYMVLTFGLWTMARRRWL